MSPELLAYIILGFFLLLLFSGLPVAFCLLGGSALMSVILVGPHVLGSIYHQTIGILTAQVLVACPLFIAMATILQYSGVATALYDMMYKWFGGLRGGLAIGTVLMCTLIAAMTGLGGTGVVTMGYLGFPEMEKRGYHRNISLGCIPSGGALGPLIPPSNIMIILAMFTSVSIGKLFLGGVFPGLMMSALFCLYIGIRCWLNPKLAPSLPREERATWQEKFVSLRAVILPLILVFIVLGTIYLGIATPSEAGGIGAFGALVCSAINRQLNWKHLKSACIAALKINTMVMWLLVGGNAFSALLQVTGVSDFISQSITSMGLNPSIIIIMVMIIGLIMGMLMDAGAIIMIVIPIVAPIMTKLGIDMLWFGLCFTINMIIGYISPPFGVNLFYTKGICPKDVTMGEIFRAVVPFVFLMLIVLITGILWPPLLVWLPNQMAK